MSPEGKVLDEYGLKMEVFYSLSETIWMLYRPCWETIQYNASGQAESGASLAAKCESLPLGGNLGSRKFWNFKNYPREKPLAKNEFHGDYDANIFFMAQFVKDNLCYEMKDQAIYLDKADRDVDVFKMICLDDTIRLKVKEGNWNNLGTWIQNNSNYSDKNFWNNSLSYSNKHKYGTQDPFSTSGRNPGPEMLVSSMKEKQGSSYSNRPYVDCVTVHVYRNMLRADAMQGNTVEGPIFLIIGQETRGEGSVSFIKILF